MKHDRTLSDDDCCPSCAGCLRIEEGPRDHRQFVCSVGHTFALWDLYEAKETELERAQWSSLALFKHLQMILGYLIDSPGIPHPPPQPMIQRRLNEIQTQITSAQQLIEGTAMLARDGTHAPATHHIGSQGRS